MKRISILMLLTMACGDKDGEDTNASDPSTLENVGVACIDGNDPDDNHSTARVTVVLSECLESCAMDPQATCEATTEGGTVTVTANGRYDLLPAGEDCAAMCIPMEAECQATGVRKGDFTLEYAGDSVEFTGPVGSAVCTGE